MDDELTILKKRVTIAIEQLRSLANEQRHRKHGCNYPEVDPEDLDEVVDFLMGKNEDKL
jgi:hypothetical protein